MGKMSCCKRAMEGFAGGEGMLGGAVRNMTLGSVVNFILSWRRNLDKHSREGEAGSEEYGWILECMDYERLDIDGITNIHKSFPVIFTDYIPLPSTSTSSSTNCSHTSHEKRKWE